MIFIDTSFFVAFALDSDLNHSRAITRSPQSHDHPVTSEDVMKETLTIVSQRKGKEFCIEFFHGIEEIVDILPVSSERYEAGLAFFLSPKLQKDISLIDCISTAICKESKIKRILSFDRHFRSLGLIVRP